MHYYTLGILAGIAVLGILYISDMHTQELSRLSDCIVIEAGNQNYAGNPYSRDAWDMFAPLCK